MLTMSQYKPTLSSITNVAPGGSATLSSITNVAPGGSANQVSLLTSN
jgi:hypothetical protein